LEIFRALPKVVANREATDKELSGGTYADGFGSFIAGLFGGLPNTSFSQNVGLISMTGVMSRSVVTLGALFLVALWSHSQRLVPLLRQCQFRFWVAA
jgi:xanthine/uracil permease